MPLGNEGKDTVMGWKLTYAIAFIVFVAAAVVMRRISRRGDLDDYGDDDDDGPY